MPHWISLLNANCELRRESLTVGSHVQLWQVPVNLDPIEVAHGRVLSSSETWNGKPLVYSTDISRAATSSTSLPNREEVAAEAAIAQLLRNAGWDAYWTRGNKRWARWIIASVPERQHALRAIDARIRPRHAALAFNTKGLPDIIAWDPVGQVYCIEYKGPKRSNPRQQDELTTEQIAWFETGIELDVLSAERCAIVSWTPGTEGSNLLKRQCEASRL